MFCLKCGNEIKKGEKFCTKCGLAVSKPEKKSAVGVYAVVGIIAIIAVFVSVLLLNRGNMDFFTKDEYSDMDYEENNSEGDKADAKSLIKEKSEEKSTQDKTEEKDMAEEQEKEQDKDKAKKPDDGLWMKAYSEYLKSEIEAAETEENSGYGLIYVNDDDIPELLMYGNCEAAGNRFLTWSDKNGVDRVQFGRLGYFFEEKNNLLVNHDGNMGYYYDIVYSIDENGRWKEVAGGSISEEYSENPEDAVTTYTWDDKDVSDKEYEKQLSKYFDRTKAAYIKSYDDSDSYDEDGNYIISIGDLFTYEEITGMLDSGTPVMSKLTDVCIKDSRDIHSYDIFVEDVTWYEARNKCSDMGGHLVRINSSDEYDYLVELIGEQGYDKNVFWLSGSRDYIGNESSYHWIANDYRNDVVDLNTDSELSKYWMDGEPSYTGQNNEGEVVTEDCMVMFFNKKEDRFVFNDVPDDITQYYKGRIAYICEYE